MYFFTLTSSALNRMSVCMFLRSQLLFKYFVVSVLIYLSSFLQQVPLHGSALSVYIHGDYVADNVVSVL